jgi:hypothetical protein
MGSAGYDNSEPKSGRFLAFFSKKKRLLAVV